MDPIVSREAIRTLARKAAAAGQHTNPYPMHTAAHDLFEEDYRACVAEQVGELCV